MDAPGYVEQLRRESNALVEAIEDLLQRYNEWNAVGAPTALTGYFAQNTVDITLADLEALIADIQAMKTWWETQNNREFFYKVRRRG